MNTVALSFSKVFGIKQPKYKLVVLKYNKCTYCRVTPYFQSRLQIRMLGGSDSSHSKESPLEYIDLGEADPM